MSTLPVMTTRTLAADFRRIGLHAGMTVIVHSSMKAFGAHIVGAEQAVVDALMDVITPEGTLVMPTHSSDNTDPALWYRARLPESLWDLIRAEMPPYRPESTPTNGMGRISECFRKYAGVIRSAHPAFSFAAWGRCAEFVTANQSLDNEVAEQSPIARIYDLDGWVLLLGVGHDRNTSLHLADYRADWPGKRPEFNGSAMLVDGQRQWVTYHEDTIASDDFGQLGADLEAETDIVRIDHIGQAVTRLIRQRALVDYAIRWFEAHRPASLGWE